MRGDIFIDRRLQGSCWSSTHDVNTCLGNGLQYLEGGWGNAAFAGTWHRWHSSVEDSRIEKA